MITEKSLEKKVGEMVDWLNSVSRSELALLGRNGVEVINREEFGKEGGRNGGLAEFRLKKRTSFTGSKWCRGD